MTWRNRGGTALMLMIGILGPREGTAQVTLQLEDQFLPFSPGTFGYDRDLGSTLQYNIFFNYGLTTLVVLPAMDLLPHDDDPELPTSSSSSSPFRALAPRK